MVKVDIRNTMARYNFLSKETYKTIEHIGEKTIVYLVKNWIRGIGGNGMTLQRPPINAGYKKYKESLGNDGKIDMVLSGDMTRSMRVKRVSPVSVSVGFGEEKRAQGNYSRRPQFMELSERFKQDMRIFFTEKMRGI